MAKKLTSNALTCSEWRKELLLEDVELTGGAVPRTERQIKQLWDIYKHHHKSLYELLPPRYGEFASS